MPTRYPVAQAFYSGDCRRQIERFLRGFEVPDEPKKATAGIVPHAGWAYSGAVAAKIFKSIEEKTAPTLFVLFGSVHSWGVSRNAMYAEGSWVTPLGEVEVDAALAAAILEAAPDLVRDDPNAHTQEHSLEVQLPFIKYFFPEAKIVPIAVVPDARSAAFGGKIGEIILGRSEKIVVVGTTDLTHYGDNYGFAPKGYGPEALAWVKENDARITQLALDMRAEKIVSEARKHHNACGSGAMAAVASAAKAMGTDRGQLIEYTTSHDVRPESGTFTMGVGYAGILF